MSNDTPTTDPDVHVDPHTDNVLPAKAETTLPPGAADAEADIREALASPAGQRDFERARRKFLVNAKPGSLPTDRKPIQTGERHNPEVASDGVALDAGGERRAATFRTGTQVKIRDNVHGLRDGGMESARGVAYGNPYLDRKRLDAHGNATEVQPVSLENGDVVTVPVAALEQHKRRTALSMNGEGRRRRARSKRLSMSLAGCPAGFLPTYSAIKAKTDAFCSARCTAGKCCTSDHQAKGDPEFVKESTPCP